MNEFRHDKDFIAVIKQIIKIKEDFLSLQAWARAQNMILAAMGQSCRIDPAAAWQAAMEERDRRLRIVRRPGNNNRGRNLL